MATLDNLTTDLDFSEVTHLRLYIAGMTQRSRLAIDNLKQFCAEHMPETVSLEIVDLLENPQLAEGDQILAVPTLVKYLPPPMHKIVGDLSNTEKMLVGLDIIPRRN